MRDRKNYVVMTEKASTGVGSSIDVRDFRHVNIVISTSGNTDATIKCIASLGEVAADFNAAQSVGNEWDYIEMAQLSNSSAAIRGNVGVVVTGTDICKIYAVNTDHIDWLTFNVTDISAGKITISLTAADNQ